MARSLPRCRLESFPFSEDLGRDRVAHGSASRESQLALAFSNARKLRKPRPLALPVKTPMRKSNLLLSLALSGKIGVAWRRLCRADLLVAQQRLVCVLSFGRARGDVKPPEDEVPDELMSERERLREQRWQALPRELKMVIRRVRVNSAAQLCRRCWKP